MLCREDGGVLDDLFTYRLGGDRFLTVTNASNHEQRPRVDAQRRRAASTSSVARPPRRLRDARRPGARRRARSSPALADGELPKRFRTATLTVAGAPGVLVCGTGYTGEDGVELLVAPGDAPHDLGRRASRRGAAPAGLGARDTLRLEVCFHLYGNDLMEERGPIEAGLGWCCKEDTGFIGSDAVRAVREAGPAEKLVAVRDHRPGHRPPGQPGRSAAAR